MRYSRRQVTQQEINFYVAQFARELMDLPFRVAPNAYGQRVECLDCHWSSVRCTVTGARDHAGVCAGKF